MQISTTINIENEVQDYLELFVPLAGDELTGFRLGPDCWKPAIAVEAGAFFMYPDINHQHILVGPNTRQHLKGLDSFLTGMIVTYCVLAGRLGTELPSAFNQAYMNLKVAIADACIEQGRGDVLEALVCS